MPKRHTRKRPTRGQGLEFNEFKTERIGQIDSRELREDNLHFTRDHKLKGSAPVEAIQGVGVQTARKMHEQGIYTVKDLQNYHTKHYKVERVKAQPLADSEVINRMQSQNPLTKRAEKQPIFSSQKDEKLTDEIKYYNQTITKLKELQLKQQELDNELHIEPMEDEWGNKTQYYELSERIDRSDWSKIARFMEKLYAYDSIEGDMVFAGWRIKDGKIKDVENALNIPSKYSLENQEKLEREYDETFKDKKFNEIKEKFNNQLAKAKDNSTYYQTQEEISLHGDRYYTSTMGLIAGGGSWIIIEPEQTKNRKIWFVENNGGDGDNWAYNNIRTGGAGAIGKYISYNNDLATIIATKYKKDREV